MKNYTPALVNSAKPKFSLKTFLLGSSAAKNYYYAARHKTEDIYILWIESVRFGNSFCFPCVLEEQGDAMVYLTGRGLQSKTKNIAMIQRWGLFAKPATFMDEYHFHTLTPQEFHEEYGRYKLAAVSDNWDEVKAAKAGEAEALPEGEADEAYQGEGETPDKAQAESEAEGEGE